MWESITSKIKSNWSGAKHPTNCGFSLLSEASVACEREREMYIYIYMFEVIKQIKRYSGLQTEW